MDFLHKYGVERKEDGVILTLYVSDFDTEFANELGTKVTSSHQETICDYAIKRFPHLKIKAIKIVCGGIMIGMCAFKKLAQQKPSANAPPPEQTFQTILINKYDH